MHKLEVRWKILCTVYVEFILAEIFKSIKIETLDYITQRWSIKVSPLHRHQSGAAHPRWTNWSSGHFSAASNVETAHPTSPVCSQWCCPVQSAATNVSSWLNNLCWLLKLLWNHNATDNSEFSRFGIAVIQNHSITDVKSCFDTNDNSRQTSIGEKP